MTMRHTLILVLSLLFSLAALAEDVKNVTAQQFFELIQKDEGVVLDVRTQGEYSRGHITNSTLISTSDRDFVKKTMLLQKDKPLYVYCLTGSRSRSVVNYLSKQGFTHLYNLSRGIMSWKQEGYTLVKSPNVAPSISKSYTANELSGILKANNLTLIDFHAPWCAPCKKVKPIVEQAQTDFSTGIKVLTLDIEANESIKNQYSINSIPGLVLFQNGKEVWRHTGVISKEDLYKSIELYL